LKCCFICFNYAALKRTIAEARSHQVAGCKLGRGTHQSAIGNLHQRIAALKDSEGRERIKARVCGLQLRCRRVYEAFDSAVEAETAGQEAFTNASEQTARVVFHHIGRQLRRPLLPRAYTVQKARVQTETSVVEPLAHTVQPRCHPPIHALRMKTIDALSNLEQPVTRRAF
jgi:hypothetical protein